MATPQEEIALEQENAALEARLAELESRFNAPTIPATQPAASSSYGIGQGLYDILSGGAKAGAGLVDIAGLPAVFAARQVGLPVEYFGASKRLQEALTPTAQYLGLRPQTEVQQIAEFMTPLPGVGKLSAAKQAVLGLAGYLGQETGQAIAPESAVAPLVGALVAPTTTAGALSAAKVAAKPVTEAGKSLQRSALGARLSDFTKQAKNQIIEDVSGDFTTQAKKSLDNVIESGQLGTTTNPELLYANLRNAKDTTEEAIQNVLAKVDATRTTGVIPRMNNTLEWIKTKAPVTDIEYYKNEVNKFLNGLQEQGQGSLVYLNQQKKALAEKWKASPQTDPTFWRTFYKDVKESIEKQAPEVKQLNKVKQDLIVVEPIIERGKRATEQGMTPQDVRRALLYTTGGLGVPGASYLLGSPVLGTLLAVGLGALGTRKGQQLTGRTLESLGQTLAATGGVSAVDLASALSKAKTQPTVAQVPTAASTGDDAALEAENAQLERRLQELEKQIQPKPTQVSALIEKQSPLVKAVIEVESKGKPQAKSGKGATGLMQLMPSTAKALGVDPKDPAQNIEGGKKYLAQMQEQFKNDKLALAAYNWGPANLNRAIAKTKKAGLKPTWENILQVAFVPAETRKYVSKVLTLKNKYNA